MTICDGTPVPAWEQEVTRPEPAPPGTRGEVQMGAMPSRAQSEFYKGLLPIELRDEAPIVFTADLKNDRFANGQPSASEESSRPLARLLIPFCIGVTATLTWQSYNDAAKQIIARGYPGYPLTPGFQHVPRWQFSVKATPNAGAPGRGLAASRCRSTSAGGSAPSAHRSPAGAALACRRSPSPRAGPPEPRTS